MGRSIGDDHFLLLFNAWMEPISFVLPGKAFGSNWAVRLDTCSGAVDPADVKPWRARTKHSIQPHSMVVLSTSVVPDEERRASRTRAAKVTPTIARTSQQ
jgi:glycogen operon protein